MPSDSDTPIKKRKPKTRRLRSSSSSSSSDDDFDIITKRTRIRQRVVSTDDDSDESIIVTQRQKKKMKVLSDIDTDSSSSDSEVASFSRRTKVQALKSESSGESDGDIKRSQTHNTMDFSTSDEDVEKCIICFKALRDVIARPSGCQHTFHSECLLTWSKTSNTCPIDRLKYTQIITSDCDGGIVACHNVTTPVPPDFNDLEPDDPTFCEICNQHDRENEMLLCDRCEAGYHLDCLDPPLIEVPIGDWYCPDCSGGNNALGNLDTELHDLLRDTEILVSRLRNRTQSEPRTRRVGPRTRAAQRVLQSIRQMAEEVEMNQPSTSRSSSTVRSRRRRRRTSASSRSTRYKLELVTVEDGSTIEVKVAVNTRKKSRSKKRKYKKCRNRSGKRSKRGSASGGGCEASSSIVSDLAQPLDIFGSRPQLDYFSGCESDDDLGGGGGGGDGLMVGRRARISHGRGPAVAKQMAAQILRTAPSRPSPRIAVSSAPPDLLSSILNEQTKWHSPNAVIQSNSEGQVTVTLPKSAQKIKKASGGEGSGSGSGGGPSGSSSGSSSGAGGGGRESSSTSLSSGGGSSSIPPLEPPPQPPKLYEDEDFDLYADIEPPLAPPPEPPALLLALEGEEGASSPEDAGLVIDDDRQTYDPELPTSPPPSPPGKKVQDKTKSKVEMVAVDLSAIRLPSPEPDPDPEIDDCPNRVFYSKTSISIAKGNEESDNEELPAPPPPPPLLLGKTSISSPSEEMDSEISEFSNGKLETEKSLEENKNIESKDVDQSEKYDPELSDEEDEVTKPSSLTDVDKNEKTSEPDNDNEPEKATVNDLPNDEKVIEKRDNEEEIVEAQDVDGETKVSEDVEAKNQITEDPTESVKQENKEVDLKAEVKDEINGECVINNMVEDKDKDDDDDDEGEEVAIKDENNKDSKSDISLKNEAIDEVAQDVKIESPKSVETKNEDVSLRDDETELEDKKETQDSPNETETKKTKRKSNDSSIGSSPSRKLVKRKADQEGDDVLELGCGDDKDGLVDITDEEISSYEKSWELEDNQLQNGNKSAGLEGLETEAISEGEDNMAEEGQIRTPAETGPKEEGEIISDEKRVPVAWKKVTKAKERSYRDKDSSKDKSKKKDKEKKPKEKRKELERYDVRKIISDKPKARKVDEFGRDISTSRSRSKSVVGSRSKSKSRSPKSVRSIGSIRSRRSRSRSLSKGRRRRSRERRSRSRSRDRLKGRTGRSRDRSRERERERNKRVRSKTKSRSRSRSESRRRRSRSRKKERRSRPKSRDKKRRKRESSLSCSSCSCSSCERERRKSKKLTVIVPNEPIAKKDKKKKYKDKGDRRRRVDSPVPSKEVFTSGDNILVSVNFSKSSKTGEISRKESSKKKKDDEPKKKKDKGSKENQPLRSIVSKSSQSSRKNKINAKNLKPVAIIDLAQSPFREQTLSPKEIIVLTDSESETEKRNSMADNMAPLQVTGPKTPPEPHIKFNIVGSKTQVLRTLTNPLLDSLDQLDGDNDEEDERADMLHKGPNTPPEPPVPYDPFEPTKSRSPSPIQNLEELRKPATPPGDKVLPPEPLTRPVSPPKPAPEPPKTPSPLHSPPSKPPEDNPPDKNHISPPNNHDDDSMDMGGGGGDSPYSPGSSDGDDMFEPPVPQMSTPVPLSKLKPRPPTKMTSKLTPSPLKRKPGTSKPLTPIKSKGSKKEVMGGMNEDQLKILDDLPNSAVEMQFLKKLNRQERVVEEVKMVLKPHYAKKHVTKEEYKEILRKSVPKICHSRSGEINPIKIQRLIEAYVKKYRHLRKKRKMPTSTTFSAPDLLKPKPKPTMWC